MSNYRELRLVKSYHNQPAWGSCKWFCHCKDLLLSFGGTQDTSNKFKVEIYVYKGSSQSLWKKWGFGLGVQIEASCITAPAWVWWPLPAPGSSFVLMRTLSSSSDGCSCWTALTYTGDLDWDPGFQSQSSPGHCAHAVQKPADGSLCALAAY